MEHEFSRAKAVAETPPLRSVHTSGCALQEIFAVQVLPVRRYPDLINDNQTLLDDSFVLTDEALSAVPAPLRTPV